MKKKKLPNTILIIDNLGAVLKQYRRKARVTQEQIAKLAGLSTNYISCLERGIYHINGRTLLIYMVACDISVSDIVKESKDYG